MFLQVLEITAPVFCLALIGYVWARRGLPYDIDFVTRLGTQVAMPCLIFSTLARAEIDASALGEMLWATLIVYGALTVIIAGALRAAGLSQRVFLPPSVANNTGNLGLPVVFFAFGDYGLALGIVLFAVTVVLQFTVGLWFVAGKGSGGEALRQPMVWSAVLGIGWSLSGLDLPAAVDNSVALVGQMGIPLMVLTLGVSISRIAVGSLGRAFAMSLIRYPLALGVALGAAHLLEMEGAAYGVLVLQAIMPAPVTNYMLALKYRVEPEEVAALVFVSTLLSVGLVPLTLVFLL